MLSMANPQTSFWEDAGSLLLGRVFSFLDPKDIGAVSRVSKNTAAACESDMLWRDTWRWPANPDDIAPPAPFSSWKEAHRYRSIYRNGSYSVLPIPAIDMLSDITCHCIVGKLHIYGCSDGYVRVFHVDLIDGRCRFDMVETSSVQLGTGSVRHMQLQPVPLTTPTKQKKSTPRHIASARSIAIDGLQQFQLWCGTWNGCVHCLPISASGEIGRSQVVISGLGVPIYALRVGFDRLFTGSGDAFVTLWNIATDKAGVITAEPAGRFEGHTGAITDFNVQHLTSIDCADSKVNGCLVSTSYDGTVRIWDIQTLGCRAVVRDTRGPVWTLSIMNSQIFTGSSAGTVKVWDAAGDDAHVEAVQRHSLCAWASVSHKQVFCLKVIGDICFSGTSDGFIHVWDLTEGVLRSAIQVSPDKDGIRRIDVDGDVLVACTARGYLRMLRVEPKPVHKPAHLCLAS